MKKSNFHLLLTVLGILCWSSLLTAQANVNMGNSGTTAGSPFTISPPGNCYFNFYDSGGPNGSYNNTANANVTFLPSDAANFRIQVKFLSFWLEPGWDAFYIYNSTSVGTNQVLGPEATTLSGFPGGNWQTSNPGTITANTGIANVGANAAEALTFQFRSDGSNQQPGWTAIVTEVPKVSCTMTAPAGISVGTGPGSNTCFVNVTTPLPTFSPGGCNAAYNLQYRVNGGAPTTVTTPMVTSIQVPKGNNVIVWELVNPCGGGVLSSATQNINVADNTPPIISCPANITFNLSDGSCSSIYTYNVSCSDNCPLPTLSTLTTPFDFDNGQAGIMFDVSNISATPISVTQFAPSLDAGVWPMEVYYTTSASSWSGVANNPAEWTLAGTVTVSSSGPASGTTIGGLSIHLFPGQTRGIYITSKSGQPVNFTGLGPGITRNQNDGVLNLMSSPGASVGYPFGATATSRAYNGSVSYQKIISNTPLQISGIPSGGDFPIGTTVNTFTCTDAAGNVATCSFSVTVNDFAGPVNSLVCNDLVIVALGQDCQTTVGADQVLEGGPYKCYDNYVVELDKIAPYGNGPWVPAVLGLPDINKTYRVRVTDPITGNKCFGDLKVQDNIAPLINCFAADVVVPCNYPTLPTYNKPATVTQRFALPNLPINVVDFQTRNLTIPVKAPTNAVINDVDLRLRITGDAFASNLFIELISPSGTIVNVWNQVSGCFPSPINVRLDDEGLTAANCPNYTTNKSAIIPLGSGLLSSFDGQSPVGDWKLKISDVNGMGDLSTIEIAELYINYTGTFTPGFPNGLTAPPVTIVNNNTYIVPAGLMDNCSDVTLSYTDQTANTLCGTDYTATITRRWLARDASGNTSVCNQTINLLRPSLNDVVFPPNYDGIANPAFDCAGVYPTPEWIQQQGLVGSPTVYGLPDGCSLDWEPEDVAVWVCDGTYNITREWNIVDPCTGGIVTHIQLIRVTDSQGPTWECPDNVSVTTDPFSCCAKVNLPDALLEDGCSQISYVQARISVVDPVSSLIINEFIVNGSLSNYAGNNPADRDTLAVFGQTPCLPVGSHIVEYEAVDDCGNRNTCTYTLTVNDFSPPVVNATEFTTVAIGVDDESDCYYPSANGCEFAGVSWVKAINLDQGSYDNCNNLRFTVRRVEPYSDCINSLNACEKLTATAESDSIKFYCCEVGTEVKVIFRVYQVNIDGTPALYPDGTPIYNEVQVKVEVQDKLKPVCEPPLNVTVNCENFDPSLWSYGKATVYDNCCLDSTKNYQGMKGLTHSVNYTNFDTTCHKGTIIRTFRSYDCHGFSSQCTQRVVVNYSQNYSVRFPDDKVITECDGTGTFGEPQVYGEDCELLGISYTDEIFTVVPDACYKIERTWKVINWCTYIPTGSCIIVPNPTPNSNINHPSNMPGPTVSPAGTPAPWAPTVVKILPTDQTTTSYSTFWNANANCYIYKQIIKVIDGQAPTIECPASPVEFCDFTPNNPLLWNESYWWDGLNESHDLCEGPADLSINATDACSGANIGIRYLLFLDLDQDGTMETVVNSNALPAPNEVRFGNATTPNFTGGTPRAFDQRAVPLNQKYRFAIETTKNGNNVKASVRWNTVSAPSTYNIPELPYGTHKIKWFVTDGCGNEKTCEYTFVVKDCKAPTVICLNGLSANVMPNGLTLFTSDFLQHAEDNCTPLDKLKFGIRRVGTGTGFPYGPNGEPNVSVTFNCDDIGPQEVELWSIDAAGNADYCKTYILVQDNLGNCPGSNVQATIAGLINTDNNNGLEDAGIEIDGAHPAAGSFSKFSSTGIDGSYKFSNAVPILSNFTITPIKDDNHINGVSTFDLVLISKHILGIQPLTTPYKMIAADANRSGSITTLDIVELRKLILGITTELDNNTSWRFVDNSFSFPNPQNPFVSPFPENKTVAQIQGSDMDENFVAVKIGDLNGNAIANSFMQSEDRSSGTLLFDVDDQIMKAGEEVTVRFKAAETVTGYQFTLNYDGLQVLDLLPGEGMSKDHFAVLASDKAVTTSWEGQVPGEFSIKFRALRDGQLSKMLGVSSRITRAEAYRQLNAASLVSDEDKLDIALRFNSENGATISGVGFELYQNQPNPFVNMTVIGFNLPEATKATLRIFDESGRMVYQNSGEYFKGYNSIVINQALVNGHGLLYYTLETSTDSATRKMIQMK